MRKLFLLIFIGSNCCLWAQKQKSPVIIPDQYIVVLKESTAMPALKAGLNTNRSANAPNKELRKQNVEKLKNLQNKAKLNASNILFNYADVIVGFSARLSQAEVKALENNPGIAAIYPDYKVELDYTIQSATRESSSAQVEDCAITTSGGHSDGSSKYTWIWILDTGIDTDHPDLNVQTHTPYAASFTGAPVEDLNGHGTHVAGIAAAKDNGEGIVGVSAGAKVVPVKVISDENTGSVSILLAGLDHVAQYSIPGDVVNMSLGYPGICADNFPSLPTALINLANVGVWMCIAAGNNAGDSFFMMPGCINNPRVLTVAALECGNACASYSNLGQSVDWYAVGSNVFSTYKDGGYATLSGTSMATPVVAGIVHSRGQAPIRGPEITCENDAVSDNTRPLAKRQ